jgi:hypothetical protein
MIGMFAYVKNYVILNNNMLTSVAAEASHHRMQKKLKKNLELSKPLPTFASTKRNNN